jgi:hypothetical protein
MLFPGISMAIEVSVYQGYAQPVCEAIIEHVKKDLGIDIKGGTLSWGEIRARLKAEKPRFGADLLIESPGDWFI